MSIKLNDHQRHFLKVGYLMILLVLYADYIASMTKRIMNVEHLVE
jgi:hypothetical protein